MVNSILFPGQGSQSVGMLADIAEQYPAVLNTFSEASDALGYDLWQVCQSGPEDKLNSTDVTQPAVLTASIALFRLLNSRGFSQPKAIAGHSLGEYSAMVAAGVFDFATAVKLVEKRGRLMQDAVGDMPTAMAAVLGLSDEDVIAVCAEVSGDQLVQAVNFNSQGQVVIAGHGEAVDKACEALKEAGAKRAIKLAVSVPCHSDLMLPGAEALAEEIAGIELKSPQMPIIHNVNAGIAKDLDELRDNLVRQLYSPVMWTQTLESLVAAGVENFIECGPGKVLAGLVKKVNRKLPVTCLSDTSAWA